MPGSTQAKTRAGMYAGGQKRFAVKIGPGAIDVDNYIAGSFVGETDADIGASDHKVEFVKADYNNPPEEWKNNPILIKTNFISALKAFRDTEAEIPAENLEIKEGYFPVNEESGELPIARMEKVGEDKYVLIVHTKFVQMWNHIRKNDVWFEANLGPNDRRTVSVAWGIFYRIAKHELTDFKSSSFHLPKNIGHMTYINDRLFVNKSEIDANMIGGSYRQLNDAIWLWFLGSYSFANTTRYNNETFLRRMNWIFYGKGAAKLKLNSEFPTLFIRDGLRDRTMSVACAINYNFFSRPGIKVPRTTIDESFIRAYEEREKTRVAAGITDEPIYAAGQGGTTEPVKRAIVWNVRVDALTEAVIAAIRNDPAIQPQKRKEIAGLWKDFIKEHALEEAAVRIAGVEKALAAEIEDKRDIGLIKGMASSPFLGFGMIGLLYGVLFDRWYSVILIGTAIVEGIILFAAAVWDKNAENTFATLTGYLEKAEEALESQAVSALSDSERIEKIHVDTLSEAVTAAIRNDPVVQPQKRKEIVGLWKDFIKEHALEEAAVHIEGVEKALAAKIKDNRDNGEFRIEVSFLVFCVGASGMIYFVNTGALFALILGSTAIVEGAVLLVAAARNKNDENTFTALAGYLEKAKKTPASQTSAAEQEETPAPKREPAAERHPFIQLVSEYIVRLGLEEGPGTEALSTTELENIYKTIALLREDNIEIFIPQQVRLTEDMQKAIKDIGKREGNNRVTCRQYSDLQNLAKLLRSQPVGKRIVITDITEDEGREEMAQLVKERPESFTATRLLNIALPAGYPEMDNIERTVYQAKIVTIAILARLFEKDKTPMVEMLLKYMLKGCLDLDDSELKEYLNELGKPDDGQGLSREALVKRILFLIGKTIKVAERIGEEIRLMKVFWMAA
ncbi:MAG: hypothetical protein V1682_07535 [Candidatus Omnitrophota bacterium]